MTKRNNDNDLIRRGEVRDALMRMAKPLVGGGIATFVVDYPNAVDSVPAVEQTGNSLTPHARAVIMAYTGKAMLRGAIGVKGKQPLQAAFWVQKGDACGDNE